MDEPGRVSDARVGEGARRVQPDRARLQSPARPQYRRTARADRRAPGLTATPEPLIWTGPRIVEHRGIGWIFHKPIANLRKLPQHFIAAEKQCFHTVCLISERETCRCLGRG